MTGEEIRRLRKRLELSQGELGQVIGNALGRDRPYSQASVKDWEMGRRPAPAEVDVFLAGLSVAGEVPDGDTPATDEPAQLAADSAPSPGPGDSTTSQPVLGSGGGLLARACEDLWEMIATGVGMIGAATGSEPLMADGAIIAADKKALGEAWGKLAETNETFRRMLVSMTEGGAWLQVAMVTGTTVSKCYQSHMAYAAHLAAQAETNGQPDYPEPADVAA